jgi:hypothetical protein
MMIVCILIKCMVNLQLKYCIINKHTIGTFSWLQGNSFPYFGVMALRPDSAIPIADTPSFELSVCSLPPQLHIYIWYLTLFIFTLLGIFITSVKAKGSNMKGLTLALNRLFHLILYIMPVYLVLTLINWFI